MNVRSPACWPMLFAAVIAALLSSLAPAVSIAADRPADPAADHSTTVVIDPVHSSVVFKIRHFDTANFFGRFDRVEGTLALDGSSLVAMSVQVDADSIDTNNKDRDLHLRSAEFFDTTHFSQITFDSTAVKKTGDKTFDVTGKLALHGVTKIVTVTVTRAGSGQNVMGGKIVGFETSLTVLRSDYGVAAFVGRGLGDEVTLQISLEAGTAP